ncbi:MAG: helix-turn-helix domain-containing protein [Burkholderiales bacterium]|nr:helix-turn-helix domain-containing protein [Burkholderiales bacterium]
MPRVILGETMYDLKEVGEMLGVTRRTLLTYLKDSRIVAQKIGGRWLFTEDNLEDFLKGSAPSRANRKTNPQQP